MALRIEDTYVNTTPGDASYPFGSAKNETTPGALDGTPLEKAIYDDILGLMQSLVTAAGITPSNTADTVLAPQYLASIFNLRYYVQVDYGVGTKVVGSDNVTYICIGANGPATATQDPVTETAPRTKWLTEAAALFNTQHPVGTYWFSEVNSSPADFLGVGTWARVLGRFVVGLSEADADFDTPGETGGSKSHTHADTLSVNGHTLTIGEIPAHTHDFTQEDTQGVGSPGAADGTSNFTTVATDSTGGGGSHQHGTSGGVTSVQSLPPYSVAYIWKRTA